MTRHTYVAPQNAWISPPHSANPWVSGKALPMGVLAHGLALIFASKQAHSHPLGHFLACWGSGEKCQIGGASKNLEKTSPHPIFFNCIFGRFSMHGVHCQKHSKNVFSPQGPMLAPPTMHTLGCPISCQGEEMGHFRGKNKH